MRILAVEDLYYLFVISLIVLCRLLPSRKLRKVLVGGIASIAYHAAGTKRKRIEVNITRAFDGSLTKAEEQQIAKGAFQEFWQDIFRWLPSRADLEAELKDVRIQGSEHLNDALSKGKGVILWESNSFGGRVLSKLVMHQKAISICQVHGVNHLGGFLIQNHSATWIRRMLVKRFFDSCENLIVTEIVDLPGSQSLVFTRVLLNRLQQNKLVCSAGDGKTGHKLIPVKFLGCAEWLSTGMVSLAKISGAPILPLFCFREKDGRSVLVFEHPLFVGVDGEREALLERSVREYAALLESYIRKYPEQYRNWHRLGVK